MQIQMTNTNNIFKCIISNIDIIYENTKILAYQCRINYCIIRLYFTSHRIDILFSLDINSKSKKKIKSKILHSIWKCVVPLPNLIP